MSYHYHNPADPTNYPNETQRPEHANSFPYSQQNHPYLHINVVPALDPQAQHYDSNVAIARLSQPAHLAQPYQCEYGQPPMLHTDQTNYHQAIAYPELPQQQWPSPYQPPVLGLPTYPIFGDDHDQGTKRKREDTDEVQLRLTSAGPIVKTENKENFVPFPSAKKNKSHDRRPVDDTQSQVENTMETSRTILPAISTPQRTYPPLHPTPGDNILSIPGAYPESSQDTPPQGPPQIIIKSEALPSSGSLQLSTPPCSSPRRPPIAPTAPVPSERPPAELPLCPEQAALVELICSGRNVFYTGSAGCGKSTVLKAFTKRLKDMGKKVRVLAPTGRAALQVGGTTFWSFAGWTPEHLRKPLEELEAAAHGKFVYRRIKQETDVLVFDEISMIENHNFERLNALMKSAWAKDKPFGGVQVIVTGDFCQLPPVKPFQFCLVCGKGMIEKTQYGGKTYTCRRHGEFRDEDKWAFQSKAWNECRFEHVHLKKIHRQNDQEFIRMLQKCRIGDPLSTLELDRLMNHKCQVNHATKLFATREQVREVNQKAFKRLTGVNHWYWCRDVFRWNQERHPGLQWKGIRKAEGPWGPDDPKPLRALEDHRFEERVELKLGMLVVLLINLDLDAGLCNGSQGIVCSFEEFNAVPAPRAKTGNKDEPENKILGERAQMKEQEIKAFMKSSGPRFKRWPVVKFHNGIKRVIFADCSIAEIGDEKPYSLLARTQIPLAPAWAMTIHKSQSLTMDRVIVNLSRSFEEGQVYVALSRASSLHGLKIEGSTDALTNGLGGNKEVQRFLREKFGALNALCS